LDGGSALDWWSGDGIDAIVRGTEGTVWFLGCHDDLVQCGGTPTHPDLDTGRVALIDREKRKLCATSYLLAVIEKPASDLTANK